MFIKDISHLTSIDKFESAGKTATALNAISMIGENNDIVVTNKNVRLFPATPSRQKVRLYVVAERQFGRFNVHVDVLVHAAL